MSTEARLRYGMSINRRRFVVGALGAGALTAVAAGCGSGREAATTGPATTAATPPGTGGKSETTASTTPPKSSSGLPNYTPYTGVTPDLPGTKEGVDAAFLKYPSTLVQMHAEKPGKGGTVTTLTAYNGAQTSPIDKNLYWQQLNDKLGVQWKPTTADGNAYTSKLATTIAGGDLPDLTMLPTTTTPDLLNVLKSEFTDLTPYLAGDKIAAYPALAAFPTAAWKNCSFNGFIAGVALPRQIVYTFLMFRADYIEKAGMTGQVKTKEDFVELCRALTDPKKRRWALCLPSELFQFAQEVFRVPNVWAEDGGKLTNAYETDQMKDAISWFAELWSAGLFNPDAFIASPSEQNTWVTGGIVASWMGTTGSWTNVLNSMADKTLKLTAIAPPSNNGTPGWQMMGPGSLSSVIAIKKSSSEARVKELLACMDWLSSPFGTQEWQFLNYGIEGHDFKSVNGEPSLIKEVASHELNVQAKVANAPYVIFMPGRPDQAQACYEYEQSVIGDAVQNPVLGLYSPTSMSKGPSLIKMMDQLVNDITLGRKKISAWDSAVKDWQSKGGNQIRSEYEDALAHHN